MLTFVSTNWVWILLIGGMLFMHLGHRGRGGGHGGGCGGGHAGRGGSEQSQIGDHAEQGVTRRQ